MGYIFGEASSPADAGKVGTVGASRNGEVVKEAVSGADRHAGQIRVLGHDSRCEDAEENGAELHFGQCTMNDD